MIKRYYEVSSSHPVCYHPPFLLCMNTSCFFDFVRFNINIKADKTVFIGLNSRYTKLRTTKMWYSVRKIPKVGTKYI